MFEQVFENLKTATEANIQLQQEMFKKWASTWPCLPSVPNGGDRFVKFQKKWAEFMTEIVQKQREVLEAQFAAGMKNIEEAFRLSEVKDPEELRIKTVELWQKAFECMRKLYEGQMHDFQAAVVKWTELVMKGAV
jgi:hypothetical protein